MSDDYQIPANIFRKHNGCTFIKTGACRPNEAYCSPESYALVIGIMDKVSALEHKLALAEKVIEAAREISCGKHVNCKEHGYAALYTAIKEFDVANG